MNKELKKILSTLDEVEFIVLEHHISIARMVRDVKSKYKASDEYVAYKLEVMVEELPSIYKGAYDFDIRMIAKIQAMNMELAMEQSELEIKSKVKVVSE